VYGTTASSLFAARIPDGLLAIGTVDSTAGSREQDIALRMPDSRDQRQGASHFGWVYTTMCQSQVNRAVSSSTANSTFAFIDNTYPADLHNRIQSVARLAYSHCDRSTRSTGTGPGASEIDSEHPESHATVGRAAGAARN
jgi:hypothetical protein